MPLAWVQLKRSAWEAAALEGLGGGGLRGSLVIHLLDHWSHRDPPVPSPVPTAQQEFNQWAGLEGGIS